jgi:hypothetical protein
MINFFNFSFVSFKSRSYNSTNFLFFSKIKNIRFINNTKFYILLIIILYLFIVLFINDNIIYCMADNNSGALSSNIPPIGITINTNDAFKYVGIGGLATGVGLSAAKMLNTLSSQSRLKLATIITGITGASFTTASIALELSSNRSTRARTLRTNVPDIEFDGVIKFGDYTIKTKINNNEVYLSELKRRIIPEFSQNVDTSNIASSSNTYSDYYTITDSHNINSMLENGDLINIIHNNPYLKLEFVLLFVLAICLSSLFSLTVITVLNKYGDKLNNYFTNKYILMYINFNRKYLNVLTWIWFGVLYFIVLLAIFITYNLIYYFEDYCIQIP